MAGVAAVGGAVAAGFLLYVSLGRRIVSARFAQRWASRLPAYAAMPRLPQTARDAKLLKWTLQDGSWVIVAEHDIHDGGFEWDQAVFYDSRGRARRTSHHFCGWEGLLGDLEPYRKARSLDEFYARAGPLQLVALDSGR